MPLAEAIALNSEFAAEELGTAAASGVQDAADAGEGAVGAATKAPAASNVEVDQNSLPAEESNATDTQTIDTTPKARRSRAPKKAADAIANIQVPDITSLPTPGGIGFLLILIVFILFAFEPSQSNGYTRLGLIWATIRGQATLNASSTNQVSTAYAPSDSGSSSSSTLDLGYDPTGVML